MEHKPRILIIENSKAYTGAFKSLYAFSEYLSNQFEFFFCLPNNSTLKNQVTKNLVVIPFLELRRSLVVAVLYFPYLFVNSIRIHRLCQREKISIIHVNDLYNLCGVVIKFFWPSYKVVYHIRLMRGSYVQTFYDLWIKLIFKYADQIICVSNAVVKSINRSHSPKLTIIHDAIPMHENHIRPMSHQQEIKLLYLANYIQGKGQNFALEAFKIVYDRIKNCSLTFAGGDMGLEKNLVYKKKLIELAEKLEIADRILFSDFVVDSELLIKSSDILLNFSESESFSMTCLEAMVYGTPVIASYSGGPADLIENEITGLLVPNRDVSRMAEVIVRLCSDTELRNSLANTASITAIEKFGLKKSSERLAAVYNGLIE